METWDCWEAASVPIQHAGSQSEQDPAPFCLCPGEALCGCRKVPIKVKVTQGKEFYVTQELKRAPLAAFGITEEQPWEVRAEWRADQAQMWCVWRESR